MRRDWMSIGEKDGFCGTVDLDRRIEAAIDGLKWETMEPGKQFPMMPALGISGVIKEFRMPKVSHVAMSNEMAPYGFYGIRAHYKNGMVQLYVVDSGTHITPVCADHWPIREGEQNNCDGSGPHTLGEVHADWWRWEPDPVPPVLGERISLPARQKPQPWSVRAV